MGTGFEPRVTDLDLGRDALLAPPPAVRHIAADSTSVVAVGGDGTSAKRLGGKRLDAQIESMEKYDEASKRPPPPLDTAFLVAVCCGVEHSCALERNGRAWTWRAPRHPPVDVNPVSWAREIARILGLRDLDEVLERRARLPRVRQRARGRQRLHEREPAQRLDEVDARDELVRVLPPALLLAAVVAAALPGGSSLGRLLPGPVLVHQQPRGDCRSQPREAFLRLGSESTEAGARVGPLEIEGREEQGFAD